MAQITGALRSATGKHHHVACGKPFGDEARQHDLVVSSDAERLRVAAGFLDGSGEDRGVRVVDRPRTDRLTRCDDLVGQHGCPLLSAHRIATNLAATGI